MKIELRALSQVIPYENNPRINDDAVEAVAASIREFAAPGGTGSQFFGAGRRDRKEWLPGRRVPEQGLG